MGEMIALAGPGRLGLGVEYHGAGTTFTSADGTAQYAKGFWRHPATGASG